MRIIALGDSLGLPRPQDIQAYLPNELSLAVTYDKVYTSLLYRKLTQVIEELGCQYIEVINRARRSSTIKDIYSEFFDHLFYFEPDIILLQVGIVDCWYRDYLQGEQIVNYEEYVIYLNAILKLLSYRKGTKLIIIGICPSSEKMYNRYPGLEKEIKKYNSALSEVADNNNIFYVDMEKYISCENPHKYLLFDDHHLNQYGNDLVASECFRIIKSIYNGKVAENSYNKGKDFDTKYLLRLFKNKKVLLFGAGETGKTLKKELDSKGVSILGFIDNDKDKVGTLIEGKKVNTIEYYLNIYNIDEIFIIITSMYWEDIVKQLKKEKLLYKKHYSVYFYKERMELTIV